LFRVAVKVTDWPTVGEVEDEVSVAVIPGRQALNMPPAMIDVDAAISKSLLLCENPPILCMYIPIFRPNLPRLRLILCVRAPIVQNNSFIASSQSSPLFKNSAITPLVPLIQW
jgi:hypothetical protein